MHALKRAAALFSAAATVCAVALMAGCNSTQVQENVTFEFPYPEHIELTWWYGYDDTYFAGAFTTLEEHPYMKRMEERTNVHMSFRRPTADNLDGLRGELESMMASGDMTDLVTQGYFGLTFEGNTIDSAIDEEIYLALNDYVDVQMPNFNALREQYSIIDRVIMTSQNNILFIPKISNIETYQNSLQTSGLVIRGDFLDELQLDVPVTVDDWYNVLTQFKVQLGVEIPLAIGSLIYAPSMSNDVFITCYGQRYELYLDSETGKVKYGAIEDGVRQYVTMMNRWISEGLAVTTDLTAEQRASDTVGAWPGSADDIMNLKSQALNSQYELVAAPDPVLNEGDKITHRSSIVPTGGATSESVYFAWECSQPAIAAKWLDQFFSEEAYMETSYGVEGEDYTLDSDGNVTFTEKVTGVTDPSGKANIRYGIAQNAFLDSFWHDPDVIIDHVYNDEAKAACQVWSQSTSEDSLVPGELLQFTDEESELLAQLDSFWNIQQGNLKGFMNGDKDLSEWDDFVSEMKEGGIDEYVAVYQSAYDRYLNS